MNAGKLFCDSRLLLFLAVIAFIYIQMRLFATQSEYVVQLAAAVKSDNQCTSKAQYLIDKISMQRGKIMVLEGLMSDYEFTIRILIPVFSEDKNRQEQEYRQLKALVQDLEREQIQRLFGDEQVPVAAVVVMACNRADYPERTIQSVLKYQMPVASKFPLFVSQDGTDSDVKSKALGYEQVTYMQHLDYRLVQPERTGELIAYYKIARHYKWALDELFYKYNFSRVIILEDDMEIAPDFFDYFEAMAALLDEDKSILAASSWNDNGQKQFVHDPYLLYRSEFFPGLGWMLGRSTWDELSIKWPKAYWDDWLRLKENHKGRHFIRPEMCRTYNFGEQGSSMGQFYEQYLKQIKLNDVQVDWKSMDLSYLLEDNYKKHFADEVKKATHITGPDAVLRVKNVGGDVRIEYRDQSDFERIAAQFGIFAEWKDGIPRTSYKGVVVFRFQTSRRLFLIGPNSLNQLGIDTLIHYDHL